jgi:heptose I phosphotransferase
MYPQKFIELSKSFFVDADFKDAFERAGLTCVDAVFDFDAGTDLSKKNLLSYRSRIRFEINSPPTTLFLKRYDKAPVTTQLKNWLTARRRISCGFLDCEAARKLSGAGINTPKTIAYGQKCGMLFEKRSFYITEKIPAGESLERKLPACFEGPATSKTIKLRRDFIARLAGFVKKFHETGCCHRDLYFSHIFYSESGGFYLIDLSRVFKPAVFAERYRVKDIAQLYYSAPAKYFSKTDRLRFYLAYSGRGKDKRFIAKVKNKARRIAKHDRKAQR